MVEKLVIFFFFQYIEVFLSCGSINLENRIYGSMVEKLRDSGFLCGVLVGVCVS